MITDTKQAQRILEGLARLKRVARGEQRTAIAKGQERTARYMEGYEDGIAAAIRLIEGME